MREATQIKETYTDFCVMNADAKLNENKDTNNKATALSHRYQHQPQTLIRQQLLQQPKTTATMSNQNSKTSPKHQTLSICVHQEGKKKKKDKDKDNTNKIKHMCTQQEKEITEI